MVQSGHYGHNTVQFVLEHQKKQAQIVNDINKHTLRAMQTSFNLDNWKPISFRNLFDVEYW